MTLISTPRVSGEKLQTISAEKAGKLAVNLVESRPSSERRIWEDMQDAIQAVLLLDQFISSNRRPDTSPAGPGTGPSST